MIKNGYHSPQMNTARYEWEIRTLILARFCKKVGKSK